MANPLRRRKPPVINGRQSRPAHSRIFPHCYAMRFALRANSKNAAIIATAIMTAPKARLDSRLRGNDEERCGAFAPFPPQAAALVCWIPAPFGRENDGEWREFGYWRFLWYSDTCLLRFSAGRTNKRSSNAKRTKRKQQTKRNQLSG